MAVKSLFLAALGLFALVQAQNPLDQLPECAQGCANTILSSSGCGNNGNCICSNGPVLTTLACCLLDNCNAQETEQTVMFAGNLCRLFGAPDVPTKAVCPSSSAAATSVPFTAGPPVAPISSMPPPAFTGFTIPASYTEDSSSSAAATSSGSGSGSEMPSMTSTPTMGSGGSSGSGGSGGSGGMAGSSSSAAAQETGAAGHLAPAVGMAGAIAGGLAAFL